MSETIAASVDLFDQAEAVRDTLFAPWTREQAITLNAYQKLNGVHPFTCGTDGCGGDLIATVRGWVCAFCDYTQNWAMPQMADRMTVEAHKKMWMVFTPQEAEREANTRVFAVQYRRTPFDWSLAGYVRGPKDLDVQALYRQFQALPQEEGGDRVPTTFTSALDFVEWLKLTHLVEPMTWEVKEVFCD